MRDPQWQLLTRWCSGLRLRFGRRPVLPQVGAGGIRALTVTGHHHHHPGGAGAGGTAPMTMAEILAVLVSVSVGSQIQRIGFNKLRVGG